jgi:hypothetical protein
VTARSKAMHPLSVLHLVTMAGILVWWSAYFWRHSPARDLINSRPRVAARQRPRGTDGAVRRATTAFETKLDAADTAIRTALADVGGGLAVLVMFAVGTGIYVRRFEIWLQARSSGEGVALAGEGLADKTLAANSDRTRLPG